MQRLITFVMGMIAGALLCHGASNFHVVRADDGFHVVRKVNAQLAEAYVDVRQFGVADWAAHPDLTAAVAQEKKQHLMEGAAASAIQDGVEQVLSDWPQP